MSLVLIQEIEVTSAGGTFTIDENMPPDVVFIYATDPLTLAANFTVALGGVPANGTSIKYIVKGVSGVTKDVYDFTIEGNEISEAQMQSDFSLIYQYASDTAGYQYSYLPQLDAGDVISGTALEDNSVPLGKLESGTSAQIIVGDNVGIPTYRTATGDVTISVLGVTTIGLGVITNQKINASAAIERSKLADGTAQHVLINDGSGVMSSEAQLATVRGGTGQDTSASTGIPTVTAGVWAVGARTESQTFVVSFDAATELGDVKVLFPYACTVTGFYAAVTKTVEATNNATITPKNNAGTTLTSGELTLTAGTTIGTAFTSTPSANNTFTAGQVLTLTVAKGAAGGKCLLTVTYTRLN